MEIQLSFAMEETVLLVFIALSQEATQENWVALLTLLTGWDMEHICNKMMMEQLLK